MVLTNQHDWIGTQRWLEARGIIVRWKPLSPGSPGHALWKTFKFMGLRKGISCVLRAVTINLLFANIAGPFSILKVSWKIVKTISVRCLDLWGPIVCETLGQIAPLFASALLLSVTLWLHCLSRLVLWWILGDWLQPSNGHKRVKQIPSCYSFLFEGFFRVK